MELKKKNYGNYVLKEFLQYRLYKCRFVVFLVNKYDFNVVVLKVFIVFFV